MIQRMVLIPKKKKKENSFEIFPQSVNLPLSAHIKPKSVSHAILGVQLCDDTKGTSLRCLWEKLYCITEKQFTSK